MAGSYRRPKKRVHAGPRPPLARYRKARLSKRRNPADGGTSTSNETLSLHGNPEVAALAKKYTDWHWGSPAKKVIRVQDRLVPNLVGIGRLCELHVGGNTIKLPKGSWIGFDPKHPHERIHLVVPAAFRERIRKAMKYENPTQPIQEIAEQAGGTHVRHKLPNVHGAPIGVCTAVVYFTEKEGDGPSFYQHKFGFEHSKGIKPILAVDVSGRLWLCGGSYKNPLPGVTG